MIRASYFKTFGSAVGSYLLLLCKNFETENAFLIIDMTNDDGKTGFVMLHKTVAKFFHSVYSVDEPERSLFQVVLFFSDVECH